MSGLIIACKDNNRYFFFLCPYTPGIGGLGGFTGVQIGTAKNPLGFRFRLREITPRTLTSPLRARKTGSAS